MPNKTFRSKDDLKKFFGRTSIGILGRWWFGVVWCDVNQMIIHFSEASILTSIHSPVHPFLQIILVLNL